MRWFVRSAVALLVAATWTLSGIAGTAVASSPGEESAFLARINALRASVGAGPLTPNAALAAGACVWDAHIMAADALSHDPSLAGQIAQAAPDWSKGGENLGMGGDVNSLFDAFVRSPEHYRNLVDPDFTEVGICVDHNASGKLFTTHRFLARRSHAAPSEDLVRAASAPARPPARATPAAPAQPVLQAQDPPAPTPRRTVWHVFRF